VDITSAFIFSGFCSLRILAPLQCRPFDQERQGLVLGDGAAALLLETERSLKNRGGKALAEVLGYGWSSDAYHLAAPQPQGLGMIRAMNQALKDSGLSAGAVDVVLAHGTGTLANDAIEARAMAKVFNGRAVPVTAAKGAVGHTIGAAGLIEANLAVTSLVEQLIPPTVNHHQLDPQCPVKVVNRPQTTALKVALTNATAFGGTNCTLLFKAWEG
jgi:3-oxoacyl-[acyl-carrier-protein] synthase II